MQHQGHIVDGVAKGRRHRLHGFTIDKKLQKGAITGIAYLLAPQNIIHSWVEVYHQGSWLNLEGFILDKQYLGKLQSRFNNIDGAFCGYGVATAYFSNPGVDWDGGDTYIQKEGINNDFGVFDSPDDFYQQYGNNLGGLKALLYKHFFRKRINANVARIRCSKTS